MSDLLFFNRTAMAPHLWFMGALVYCYLFYRLLARKRLEERAYLLIPVLLAANLLLGEGRGLTGIAVPGPLDPKLLADGLSVFPVGQLVCLPGEAGKADAAYGLLPGSAGGRRRVIGGGMSVERI